MKLLVILWGESYRSGVWGQTRTRGTGDYKRRQILASKSHISFFESLQSKGHTVDVILNTYELNENDDKELLSFYYNKSNLIGQLFHPHIFPDEITFFKCMFDIARQYEKNYDLILFIRVDLYLKQYFLETYVPNSEKVIFAHIDSNCDLDQYNEDKTKGFRIAQIILSIPKSLFWLLTNKCLDESCHPHEFRNHIVKFHIPPKDIDFLVRSPFLCSTCSGWNPLYIQVGRVYNKCYSKDCNASSRGVEYRYDYENDIFIEDRSQTIDKWRECLEKDSLEENLANLKESTFLECLGIV